MLNLLNIGNILDPQHVFKNAVVFCGFNFKLYMTDSCSFIVALIIHADYAEASFSDRHNYPVNGFRGMVALDLPGVLLYHNWIFQSNYRQIQI
jgi:hypothetical protein